MNERLDLLPPMIGTVLSGRYRLESKLGSGGMSTVYLARDETLQRWVAVKVMHREISDQPDQLERFRREARAVAQLSHPNVVAGDRRRGGRRLSLHRPRVRRGRDAEAANRSARARCRSTEAAAYGIEIGRGLAAAPRPEARPPRRQAAERPHRRRGPGEGHGLRHRPVAGVRRASPTTGRVLGTTDYVAPEQAMGQGVDARIDIYSLGVLFYEMLTGEVPFQSGHPGWSGDEARQRARCRMCRSAAPRSPRRSPR